MATCTGRIWADGLRADAASHSEDWARHSARYWLFFIVHLFSDQGAGCATDGREYVRRPFVRSIQNIVYFCKRETRAPPPLLRLFPATP